MEPQSPVAPPSRTDSAVSRPDSALSGTSDCSTPSASLCYVASPPNSASHGLPPPPTSEPNKKEKKLALEFSDDNEYIRAQILITGNIIKSLIEKEETKRPQPTTNDALFGEMVVRELKSMPESFNKDMVKLDIQKKN